MTETKKTKAPNPIYQGEYTYNDLIREEREGNLTEQGFRFRSKFSIIPSGEVERWEWIDREAKAKYDGPKEWDIGPIWDIGEYLPHNISGLEYFRTYYDLSDEEAITKRLETIRAISSIMEERNGIYLALRDRVTNDPELMDLIGKRSDLYGYMILGANRFLDNLHAALISTTDRVLYSIEERDLSEYVESLREITLWDIGGLEAIIGLGGYEDLKNGPYAPVIRYLENALSEDQFIEDFEAFRIAHEGEGYRDALVRMARGTIWDNLGLWSDEKPEESLERMTTYGAESLERMTKQTISLAIQQQRALKDIDLEKYREYVQGITDYLDWSKKGGAGPTLPNAITDGINEAIREDNIFVSRGPISMNMVDYKEDPSVIQTTFDEEAGTYRALFQVTVNDEKGIQLQGHIDGVGGEGPAPWHKVIMDTIANLFKEKYHDDYEAILRGGYIKIPETELYRKCRKSPEARIEPEIGRPGEEGYIMGSLNELKEGMKYLRGSSYTGDLREYMEANSFLRKLINLFDPDCNGHIEHPLINWIRYETENAGGRIWKYKIVLFPLIPLLEIGMGFQSKYKPSIQESPRILIKDIPPIIRNFLVGTDGKEGLEAKIHILKPCEVNGEKTLCIPAPRIKEWSQIMNLVLATIDTNDGLRKTTYLGYFDLSLCKICQNIWKEEYGTDGPKDKARKRGLVLSYLYRLWIMGYKIKAITVLTSGRSWNHARVYLRQPKKGLDSIPAFMKDPETRDTDK